MVAFTGLVVSPTGQRCDRVAVLNGVDRVVVGRTVGFGAADDPDVRCRCIDGCEFRWDCPTPSGGTSKKLAASFPSCASRVRRTRRSTCRALVGDSSGLRVGHRNDHWLAGYMHPCARIERVEIRSHDDSHVRDGKVATLSNAFMGPPIPVALGSILMSCFRVTSMETMG